MRTHLQENDFLRRIEQTIKATAISYQHSVVHLLRPKANQLSIRIP